MRLQLAGSHNGVSYGFANGGQRNGTRRGWGSTILMVAGTLAIAVVSYSLSIRVSGERAEVDRIARQNLVLADDLKSLDAELRVRMRLPELQRWNDDVLGLMPISATQYINNPLQLANYADAPAPERPLTLAVAPKPATPAPAPRLISQQDTPAAMPARPAFTPAAPTYAAPEIRKTAAQKPARIDSAPAKPTTERKRGAMPDSPVRSGLDPLLIAAIDDAARREAQNDGPANLLVQVDLADSRLRTAP